MNIITKEIYDNENIMFAPEYYFDENEYLYITRGSKSERVYVQKDWGSHIESWYIKGNNHFSCYKKDDKHNWKLICENVLDTSEFDDVMKISILKIDNKLKVWFSGLKNNHWDIYYSEINSPDSNSENIKHPIKKISIKPFYDSEIHNYLPCVIYEDKYKMWYASRNSEHRRIFYTESTDGINWVNNRLVLDIGEELEGDHYAADCPNVVAYENGYIMFYGGGTSRGIHLAISSNGLMWGKKGLIIPRGSEMDGCYNYSFYPAIACKKTCDLDFNKSTLYFAGEDINNDWSILSFSGNFLENIKKNNVVSYEDVGYIYEYLKKIPKTFFVEQEDCNRKDYYYEDEEVIQLRPSTVPVFRFKKKNLVVKLMENRVKAENEYKARQALCKKLNVVDTDIYFMQDNILLIMSYVEGETPLNELFAINPKLFKILYTKMLYECSDVIKRSCYSMYLDKMQYTGQTLELMNKWCDEISEKYQGIELINYISGKRYNISEQLQKAKKYINSKPNCCVLFNGDLNLHNVLCVRNDIKYIDFEYWGYYDLDYVIAKIIGSLYKHCKCFNVINYYSTKKEIGIRYELDEVISPLFSMDLYFEVLAGIKVNYERIKSYILAKLYFRFKNAYENLQMKNKNNQNVINAVEDLTIILGVLDLFDN